MAEFEFTSNTQRVEKVFKVFPKEMAKRTITTFNRAGNMYLNLLRRKHLTGGTTDDRLAVRSGALRRSFFKAVLGLKFDDIRLLISSGLIYSKVQEGHEDGRPWLIKAKPGKALAIPLDAAKTEAGVARYTGPRDPSAPPMHLIPLLRGKGKALLVDSISGEPMFLLVKKVEIPPRLHATDEMRKFLPVIADMVGKDAEEVWMSSSLIGKGFR